MKRLILHILLITILSGVFAMPAIASAQTATAAATPVAQTQTPSGSAFEVLNPLTWPQKALDAVVEYALLPAANFTFAISGYMLDWSIDYSLNFAKQVGNAGSSIVLGWTIVRDIFNMFFIFALIYISITIMLGTTGFLGKVTLKNIIIAALLINFSFFFTEVLIDAGNIMGGWLYGGIETVLKGAGATSPISATASGVSISAGLSGALGVYSIYDPQNAAALVSGDINSSNARLLDAYIRLALVIFATYIFAYVAILFLARTVSLLFMLVISPIGFAGWILPLTKEMASEWKDEMEKNILLAPAFLLYLYIIIAFVSSPLFNAPNIAATTTNAFNPTQYFKYFLLAAFLLYALDKAKKYSGKLGGMVSGLAKQIASTLANVSIGIATGGTSMALTAGAAALKSTATGAIAGASASGGIGTRLDTFRNTFSKTFKENTPPLPESVKSVGGKFLSGNIAGGFSEIGKRGVETAKSSSWDIRNIPTGGGNTLGKAVEKATGVEGLAQTPAEAKKQKAEWEDERKIQVANGKIIEEIKKIEAAKGTPGEALAVKNGKIAMADASAPLTNKQLEKIDKSAIKNAQFIQSLSQSQVEHLAEKTDMSDEDKAKIWSQRLSTLSDAISTGVLGNIKGALRDYTDKELENFDFSKLSATDLENLSSPEAMKYDKFNSLMKSGKVNASTKQKMREARYAVLDAAIASGNSNNIPTALRKYEEAEIAKMSWDKPNPAGGRAIPRLGNINVIHNLTPKVLGKLLDELDPVQRSQIRTQIVSAGGSATPPGSTAQSADWLRNNPIGKTF